MDHGLAEVPQDLQARFVVLTEGPSRKHPDRNNRTEIMDQK